MSKQEEEGTEKEEVREKKRASEAEVADLEAAADALTTEFAKLMKKRKKKDVGGRLQRFLERVVKKGRALWIREGVQEYLDRGGPGMEPASSYEALFEAVHRKKEVVDATRRMLSRMRIAAAGPWDGVLFLKASLIAQYPDRVFEMFGKRERAVYMAASELLEEFWKEPAGGMAVHLFFAKYVERFFEWKTHDERRLRKRLKKQLLGLNKAKEALGGNKEGGFLLQLFEGQIRELKERLKLLGEEEDEPPLLEEEEEEGGNEFERRFGYANLAQEVVLNPSFQLPDEPYHDSRAEHELYWRDLEKEARGERPWLRVWRILRKVQEGLRWLKKEEVIDLESIHQEIVVDGKEWGSVLERRVLDAMVEMQSKTKGEETRAQWESEKRGGAVVAMLRFLLERVEVMRIEHTNVRLRKLSVLLQHGDGGVTYLREKFQEKLNDKELTETRTRKWISSTAGCKSAAREEIWAFMCEWMMGIIAVKGDKKLTYLDLPETFVWDCARIQKLSERYRELLREVKKEEEEM